MVAFGILWEVSVLLFAPPAFLIPSLSSVLTELSTRAPWYLAAYAYTVSTALLGFVFALISSLALAAVVVYSKRVGGIATPTLVILKSLPTIALAPLLVLWFGFGLTSKVLIVILVCFMPLYLASLQGFRAVDPDALLLFRSLRASPLKTFFALRLPSALPALFPAIKTAVLFAITGAFIGEFMGSKHGIGTVLIESLHIFNGVQLYAALLTTALGGLVLFSLLSYLERTIVFWHTRD